MGSRGVHLDIVLLIASIIRPHFACVFGAAVVDSHLPIQSANPPSQNLCLTNTIRGTAPSHSAPWLMTIPMPLFIRSPTSELSGGRCFTADDWMAPRGW